MTLAADSIDRLALLGLLWLGYFALHSALASLRVKAWVASRSPKLLPGYRAGFNIVSAVLLIPIVVLIYLDPGPWLWRWQGIPAWCALGVRLAAIAGFVASLRSYDLAEFLGSRQLRRGAGIEGDYESLRISTLHRFVRHPWYFLGLVVLWSGDMNAAMFLTAVMVTAYVVVGARLEEGKLLVQYGDAYASYIRNVGGLFPRPWKVLSRQQAAEIESAACTVK